MNKKIGGIIISLLLLSTVLVYPVIGKPINLGIGGRSNDVKTLLSSSSNEENIESAYNQLIDTICKHENPYDIICDLFSYREIKDIIQEFSNARIMHILEVLFSHKHPLLKIVAVKQFSSILEDMRQNEDVRQLEHTLDVAIKSNFSSPEDILSLFDTVTTLSPDDIAAWQSNWGYYLENNPQIKLIIEDLDFNPFLFAIICIIALTIWGFLCGGAFAVFPIDIITDIVMIVTAVVLGIGSGLYLGIFFDSSSPLLSMLLELLPISENLLLGAMSAATCLVVVVIYGYMGFYNAGVLNLITRALSCGLFVVWPPVLAALLFTYLFGGA